MDILCLFWWDEGGQNLAPWANELLKFAPVASAPSPDGKAPLVLARKRTRRPDLLNNLRIYRDGWDVTNKHYWAVSCCSSLS